MTNPIAPLCLIIECRDCGHDFHPDSSPHPDRCWECAELADADSDTLTGGAR